MKKLITFVLVVLCAFYAHCVLTYADQTTSGQAIYMGDADNNKTITANDCAVILSKVLDDSYTMPVEVYNNGTEKMDVNGDNILTASDSAYVLQKSLSFDSSFFDTDEFIFINSQAQGAVKNIKYTYSEDYNLTLPEKIIIDNADDYRKLCEGSNADTATLNPEWYDEEFFKANRLVIYSVYVPRYDWKVELESLFLKDNVLNFGFLVHNTEMVGDWGSFRVAVIEIADDANLDDVKSDIVYIGN